MLINIYYGYNPNYYKEGICNDSKQFFLNQGKTLYVDFQRVDFAGNVVNPKINFPNHKAKAQIAINHMFGNLVNI